MDNQAAARSILEKLNAAAAQSGGFVAPHVLANIISEVMFGHPMFRETRYSVVYNGRYERYRKSYPTQEFIGSPSEKEIAGKVMQRMVDKGVLLRTKNNTYKPLMTVDEYKATL